MRCPQCQKELSADANFCQQCGTSIDYDATRKFTTPRSTSSRPSFDSIDDARFVPGTILADRYRIVGLLGKGGMGEVYRADDLKLSQPVALKFLPSRFLKDGAALARFHREVRVARQVSHKNVCRVYDIGEIDGHQFLSMEFIKGEELSSLLRRIGRLPADKALQIARQICAGLTAAHESGVLHRDLKPANVMIDSDGNARITDFGLAGLEDEFHSDELAAGTPAYMAPEQLDGTQPSIRTDIYSLGLLLYELFTGKRAFEASNLNELLKLRRSDTSPTNPSEIVKDLDPLIERVIHRCLERDPHQRPTSALQVASALPGGDPLAAAIAAGETPSPEMVAAAPKRGMLQPTLALGLLGGLIAALLGAMWLGTRAGLHSLVPLPKSPEVLTEQAKQLSKSLGYEPGADQTYNLEIDRDYFSYLVSNSKSMDPKEAIKVGQPSLVWYWYRQSPDVLYPKNAQFVMREDPPLRVSGMVNIVLDTEGRLVSLEAVPGQHTSTGALNSQMAPQPFDFEILLRAAGLDPSKLQPIPSQWTPPHAYDRRMAWSGVYPLMPQIPLRVEAAAFEGKPVYFQLVNPWTKSQSNPWEPSPSQTIGTKLLIVVFFASLILGAFLALNNLRLGRGDRKGALRLTFALFVIRMVHWVFATHHVGSTNEMTLVLTGLQSALFWSFFVGLLYLALEPYLRRRWPQTIISWNRLLSGDFRDPLVGRDILIGAFVGSIGAMLMFVRYSLPAFLGGRRVIPDNDGFDTTLVGISALVELLLNQLSASLVQALMILFVFLILSLVLRRDWLGITVGTIIVEAIFGLSVIPTEPPFSMFLIALVVGIFIVCVLRFGLVSLITCLMFFHLWVFFPVTFRFSAWYAPIFLFDLAILMALALYGFYTSLGGQPLLRGKLLED